MRNISRINNYYNRIEAENDWQRLATKALQCGYALIVSDVCPAPSDGWRKIDKAIAEFRRRIAGDGI